jgi:hypothetical protein
LRQGRLLGEEKESDQAEKIILNMGRKKIDFKSGDVFAVPLNNNKFSIGQVLDQRMVNTVRIALHDEIIESLEGNDFNNFCNISNLISLIEVTKEQLTYGVWKILGNKLIDIPISKYPNEKYRSNKWIDSTIHDAALAEDFLNAFYSLRPWDNWYDPNYLDEYLVDITKKPKNLILVKTNGNT